jgi:hypothetical protein
MTTTSVAPLPSGIIVIQQYTDSYPHTTSYPVTKFHDPVYLGINKPRLEHFIWMNIPIAGKSILEPGAGIGDHTLMLCQQGADVTPLEPRTENRAIIASRFPDLPISDLDLDDELKTMEFCEGRRFDLIYAYGVLYHLTNPLIALNTFKELSDLLVLETCVRSTTIDDEKLEMRAEPATEPHYSFRGMSAWPGLKWLLRELSLRYNYIYSPTQVPNHPAFVKDENWDKLDKHPHEARLVLVCSATELKNDRLVKSPLLKVLS